MRTERLSRWLSGLILGGAALTMTAGCTATASGPGGTLAVGTAPPPDQVEVVGAAPGPDFVWIGGFYGWEGGRYVWHPGYWGHRPYAGAVWVGGGWWRGHDGWHYRGGHWH